MQKTGFKSIFASALFTLTFMGTFNSVQAQCPGCIITLPPLPIDTIYLSPAPDGEVFVPYEADLSFRLPMTTTPVAAVDPTVPPGFTIDEFTITGVSGLPLGLDWEAPQTVFDPSVTTDGCVRICGTPIVSDTFFVSVEVSVVVFGISNAASFPVAIYIAPATSSTDGFSMSNNSGCGETTVEFTNNVPSNGNPAYSYSWDFGNGTFSDEENPDPLTYNMPGTYLVEYVAEIDTIGHILTMVSVLDADCDDIIGDPDFYIIVSDPLGNTIYTSGVIDNMQPPVNFVLNIPLGPGNYSVEVRDDDLIGSEGCGSVNFNQTTTGSLFDGQLEVNLTILNPLVTINSVDTVYVYDIPAAPVINQPGDSPCPGEELLLEIVDNNYPDNLQWYQDSVAINGETTDVLSVLESGMYWVQYTSADGCIAVSNLANITFQDAPLVPTFTETNNVLSISDPGSLPTSYTLYWYLNEELVYSGPETEYCAEASGLYLVIVEDLITGCTASFEQEITINPEINCTVGTQELVEQAVINVYPNPFGDLLFLEINAKLGESITVRLLFPDGKVFWQGFGNPGEILEIAAFDLPAGFYLLEWQTASTRQVQKLIKQ